MRTIEDYDEMRSNWTPEALRTYMRTLRNNVRNLEEIYEETREKGPDHTIQAFVDEVGYTDARETIATLILRHAWDGRIGRRTAEWAMSVEDAWDEQAADRLDLYTNEIHMAHLDQIGREMAKYEKEMGKDLEME